MRRIGLAIVLSLTVSQCPLDILGLRSTAGAPGHNGANGALRRAFRGDSAVSPTVLACERTAWSALLRGLRD